jgi:hypothetical protein
MEKLEFHELADLFPLMSDDEVDALGEDMLVQGQLKRIMRYEGKILDGRNRYIACQRKGIEPRYVDYHGSDPVELVISLNLKRRHLDDSQRSIVTGKLENLKHGQTKADMPIGISRPDAASMLNVSKRSVARASDVIDHGVPDLVDAVEHGKVKVSAAAEFAKQNPPLDQARLIAEHGSPAAAVKAVAADTAEKKRSVKAKADRAEKTAAAKLAASKPEASAAMSPKPGDDPVTTAAKLIGVLELFGRVNVSGTVARMSNDDRITMMTQLVRANSWINKTVVEVAISGGANLGKLAPVNLRLEALEFLKSATARIEAELAGRAGPAS